MRGWAAEGLELGCHDVKRSVDIVRSVNLFQYSIMVIASSIIAYYLFLPHLKFRHNSCHEIITFYIFSYDRDLQSRRGEEF